MVNSFYGTVHVVGHDLIYVVLFNILCIDSYILTLCLESCKQIDTIVFNAPENKDSKKRERNQFSYSADWLTKFFPTLVYHYFFSYSTISSLVIKNKNKRYCIIIGKKKEREDKRRKDSRFRTNSIKL